MECQDSNYTREKSVLYGYFSLCVYWLDYKKTFELKERNNPVYDQVMVDVLKIRSELSAMGHQIDYYTHKDWWSWWKINCQGSRME